jgi:hypothetical protein
VDHVSIIEEVPYIRISVSEESPKGARICFIHRTDTLKNKIKDL